jgi:hypothetical protein
MTLTADTKDISLLSSILATELEYGELAYGPNFLLDFKLFSATEPIQSVSAAYQLVKSIYTETPLPDAHLEPLLTTIDRDETSDSWNAKDNISDLTAEAFGPWLVGCCLAEEYFTKDPETEDPKTEDSKINPYKAHRSALDQLIQTVQPLLFDETKSVTLYTLTDVNNENTPYSVYLAIGPTHTLLVVSHWIL